MGLVSVSSGGEREDTEPCDDCCSRQMDHVLAPYLLSSPGRSRALLPLMRQTALHVT